MNTGNTYYFIDDFNKICKCKNGMKSDESIILETYELINDINHLIEENEQLKDALNQRTDQCDKYYKENEELKQEVELLREGLDAYDNNLPLYLTCREVRDFNSDLFEFKIKQQKFYNEHPNRCKIIIDGVELK